MYCINRFSNPPQILSLEIIPKVILKFILYYKIYSYRKKKSVYPQGEHLEHSSLILSN